jgi:hypothetical protein
MNQNAQAMQKLTARYKPIEERLRLRAVFAVIPVPSFNGYRVRRRAGFASLPTRAGPYFCGVCPELLGVELDLAPYQLVHRADDFYFPVFLEGS